MTLSCRGAVPMKPGPTVSRGTLVIKGWYGEKNFGDDLLLASLTNALRGSMDFRIVLWCRKRSYLCRIAPGTRILEPWTRLEQPVALLWGGGTQFFTFSGSDKQWNTLGNLLSIPCHPQRLARAPLTATQLLVRRLRAARLRRVAWRGAIGIGVGPFREANRQMEEKLAVLRSMDWLSVRDEESLNICKEYGIHKAVLGADLAFLHPAIGLPQERGGEIRVIPRISPMDRDWSVWEDTLYSELRRFPPDSVEVVSLCERDHVAAAQLAERLGASLICWDPDHMPLEWMIEKLSTARRVVSARYHGALVSAAAGVPTVIMGLEPKLRSLGQQLAGIAICESPSKFVEAIRQTGPGGLPEEAGAGGLGVSTLRARAEESINGLVNELQRAVADG